MYVKPATLWEHGGLERPSSARVSARRSHIWQPVWVGMRRLDHCSQRQYNKPLDRTSAGRNLEEFRFVEDRPNCTLKPVSVHLVLRGACTKFDDPMPLSNPGRYVKPCWRHFGSMAWRETVICAHALLLSRTFGSRFGFWVRRLDHCSQRQYNRSNLR
jgi:hypothetical protein